MMAALLRVFHFKRNLATTNQASLDLKLLATFHTHHQSQPSTAYWHES